MKGIAVLLFVLLASPAVAAPPGGLPWVIRGHVVGYVPATTQPTTRPVEYGPAVPWAIEWSDTAGGYPFLAPGRPDGWEIVTVDPLTFQASIGGAVADWSAGVVGQPLVEGDYFFAPSDGDGGLLRDPTRMGYYFVLGMFLAWAVEAITQFLGSPIRGLLDVLRFDR
jgi:hypothetical protein